MAEECLTSKTMTLFFTGGVSLKTWIDVGNIDREIAIYEKLSQKINEIFCIVDIAGQKLER